MNENLIILAGRLCADAEDKGSTKYSEHSSKFRIASNTYSRKDENGDSKEETLYINCKVYGNSAQAMNNYGKKGRNVYVKGSLKLSQWENNDGQKQNTYWVKVSVFNFIDPKPAELNNTPNVVDVSNDVTTITTDDNVVFDSIGD